MDRRHVIPLEVDRGRDDVTRLRLCRPAKANALDDELVAAIAAALTRCATDGTRLVVIAGAGRHFCAGFDLTDFRRQSHGDLLLRFVRLEEMLALVRGAPFVTAALVHGSAVGAGADLAAACTHRIGNAQASFRFPGAHFGVVLGTSRLAALVGPDAALGLVTSARTIDAPEAMRHGLLSRLVDDVEAPGVLDPLIADVAGLEPQTVLALRRAAAEDIRDRELGLLARSVARPGLHQRLEAFVSRGQRGTADRSA